MKNLYRFCLLVSFLMPFLSCQYDEPSVVGEPAEGEYEVAFFNAEDKLIFTRNGEALYLPNSTGAHIRLDDPEFGTDSQHGFATLVLNINQKVNAPETLSNSAFKCYLVQRWYGLETDWGYAGEDGELKIQATPQRKMKAKFEAHLKNTGQFNPAWGEEITIKGKFYGVCTPNAYRTCE